MFESRPAASLDGSSGQVITEYVIVAFLVALIVIFSIARFESALGRKYSCSTGPVSRQDVADLDFPNQQQPAPGCTGANLNVMSNVPTS
jgi:hypothetical protein